MATGTGGTNANNSLTTLQFKPGFGSGMATADVASIANAILDDVNITHPIWPVAFTYDGQLFIPNRGVLHIRPGDRVMVDSSGWPILVSARAISAGGFTSTS